MSTSGKYRLKEGNDFRVRLNLSVKGVYLANIISTVASARQRREKGREEKKCPGGRCV